jgi:hypothetical protein
MDTKNKTGHGECFMSPFLKLQNQFVKQSNWTMSIVLLMWQNIIDITAPLSAATVAMDSKTGLGEFRYLMNAIDEGDFFNGSGLKDLTAHAGTHVDAPGHFINVSVACRG